MKVLFITLEQSGRQILKSLLDEKFFKYNKNQIYTFGMDNNYKDFIDITNIKINSIKKLNISEHAMKVDDNDYPYSWLDR